MYNMSSASVGVYSNKSNLGSVYTHLPEARIPFGVSGVGIELPPFAITADGTYLFSVSLNIQTTDLTTTLISLSVVADSSSTGEPVVSDFVYNRLLNGVLNNYSTFFFNSTAGSDIGVTVYPIYSGEAVGVVPSFVYYNSLAKIV
jgi:hypothetical protein